MKKLFQITAFLFLLFVLPAQSYGEEDLRLHQQAIKVGLLYNFLKYIEWPHTVVDSKPINVCIIGADPFDGYLQPMAGRTVNQRPIAIRSIHEIQEATACQLVYIDNNEKDRWPQLMKVLAGKNILTVGDFKGFTDFGGMIEFGLKDDRINVQLNIDAVKAEQLRVQERLLKLVTIIHPVPSERDP